MAMFHCGETVEFIHGGYRYIGEICTTDYIPYAIHNIKEKDGTVYANIPEQQIQRVVEVG